MIKAESAIELIRQEYTKLDKITGIDSSGIQISLSSRMKTKYGYFMVEKKFLTKPILKIVISKSSLYSYDLFYEVIRHEYAHALVYLRNPKERHVHDIVWKQAASEVGCNPSAKLKKDKNNVDKCIQPKYRLVCNHCSAESVYYKKSKFIKIANNEMPGRIYCKKCLKSDFSVITEKQT